MPNFSIDDRGNVVDFYEEYEDGTFEPVARLDREAGPPGNVDSVTTWNGGDGVTSWAQQNGYADEIATAAKA